jgi:hypothetical protein
MLQWVSLTWRHIATIHSPFSSQLITSNFSSIPIVFHWFFTWIAVSDVDLHFSPMLVRMAYAVEEENTWAIALYHPCHQSIYMNDDMTVTSLSNSLLKKISVATNHLREVMLNWKLSRVRDKWHKFSSRITVKMHKKKWHKTRPACIVSIPATL